MTGIEVSLESDSQVVYSKATLEETVHDDFDDYDDIIIEDEETGRMNKNIASLIKKEENDLHTQEEDKTFDE